MDYFKILVLISSISFAAGKCPTNCVCETPTLGSTVYCSPSSQEELQVQILGLPEETVELHIGDHGGKVCNLQNQILDNTFKKAPKTLSNLYIEKCEIKSIGPLAFEGLTNVQDLFIIGNPLKSLPNSLLKGLTSLAGFIVRSCPLTTLDAGVFTNARCFRRLEISGTQLKDVNTALGNLNCITNLNVSHNNLAKIEKKLFANMNLLELDVSYNPMLTFDDMVFNDQLSLNSLHLAGVSQDGGKELPDNLLSGLVRLNVLDISNDGFTDITKLELFLKDVLELRYLDASGNNLKRLNNENLYHLTSLETLHLGNCNIEVVEVEALRGTAKLNKLDLNHNSISSIPNDLFIYAMKVKDLDLSFNSIKDISSNSFGHLDQLDKLNLAGSNLATVNKAMFPQNLQTVTALDLSNSSIVNIEEDALDSLTGLTDLNLNNNDIKSLPKSLLENLSKRGVSLDISDNDWNCDCQMYLYREWMMDNHLNYSMICAEPPERKGMDVMYMPEKEMFGCHEPSIKDCCDYNVTVTEGDTALFKCSVEAGDPKPTLSIEVIDGDPLPVNKTQISSDKSTIVVSGLSPENSGNFSCTASNAWGNTTKFYHLTVEAVTTTTEMTTTTIEPNTTTEGHNTTIPEHDTTTAETTTVPGGVTTALPLSTALPIPAPSGLSGAVIGVIIVLILIALAGGAFLIAYYIKKRRTQEDQRGLVANQQSPGVQA